MARSKLNFIIDAVAFVGFALLTTTGVLMHYVLPPGSGRASTVWGLDRHGWGTIHFWVAVTFLGLLALHLVLHANWIVGMVRGPRSTTAHPGARVALGLVGLLAVAALVAAPLLSQVERPAAGGGEHGGGGRGRAAKAADRPEIRGSMSLHEVSEASGVPIEQLRAALKLPDDFPSDDRLGPLQQKYGFDMRQVRDAAGRSADPPPNP